MNNCRISFVLGLLVSVLALLTILATSRGGTSSSLDLVTSSRPASVSLGESLLPLPTRNASLQSLRLTRQHCSGLKHIPVEACRFSDVRRMPPAQSNVVANERKLTTLDNDEWSRITCPSKGSPYRTIPEDNTGRDSEMHTSKVVSKYTTYSARCAANHGIMWARMSSGMHRRIMQRTVGLLLNLIIPSSDPSSTTKTSSFSSHHHNDELVKPRQQSNVVRRQLHVLDKPSPTPQWNGCELRHDRLKFAFHGRNLVEQSLGFLLPEKPPLVRGLGIDLIEAGIVYSNATYRSPSRLFCQADGSRLPWVPDRMFDWVVSLGSASLLPNAVRCSVVRMLLSEKLRPRGAMWLGYVPGNVACDFFCFDSDDDDSANLRHLCHNQLKTRSLRHETDVAQRPQSVAAQSKTSGEIEKNAGPIGILTNSSSSGSDTIVMATTTTTISLLKEQALWKGLRIHRYYQGEYSMVWKKAPEH
ncbi:membrane-associated protein, putative [Bodo saltans]|uniref:Membrane-associated protein, putative n=1 Tax=Bodo saltans TaxID=75058 RepID=A0A0S4J4G7_BODSA|nr:membrane-associated protein, putative [Bodo saltans]|eukprot:CUG79952.1 membrane-associated protein, putative [Bodo saltans]